MVLIFKFLMEDAWSNRRINREIWEQYSVHPQRYRPCIRLSNMFAIGFQYVCYMFYICLLYVFNMFARWTGCTPYRRHTKYNPCTTIYKTNPADGVTKLEGESERKESFHGCVSERPAGSQTNSRRRRDRVSSRRHAGASYLRLSRKHSEKSLLMRWTYKQVE